MNFQSPAAPAAETFRPKLARPPRRDQMLRPLRFLRALQDNFISAWPEDAYSRDVTHVRIGRSHMFTANTPELAKHVLLDNAANYSKSPIARRFFEPALGKGLVIADGPDWKRHRQLVAPIFVQRRIAALVPAIVEETEARMEAWRAIAGQPFDLTESLSDITLDIITRTMFGAESRAETLTIGADAAAYQTSLRPSLLDFVRLPEWLPRPGRRKARAIGARLTDTIHRVIAGRRALDAEPGAQPRDDLLALLLQAMDRGEVTRREIRDEIATVFTAGHETTAAALGWALYLLDLHPWAEERLSAELDEVLDGRLPTAADVERLRFTRMVVDETLRLYPPAHTLTRLALGPDRLGDVAVPKGAVVLISPWLLQRNPLVWPDPERFDPDRFHPERAGERSRYAYIPFGAGPRICVGAGLAITEMVLVLATMLRRYRVRLVPGHKVEPRALMTMRPHWGLKAVAEPRA